MNAATTLGQVSSGRENNFDFMRFCFATLVICAHSYPFLYTGLMANDPLVRFSQGQVGIGDVAVHGFFLISGFLITRSWLYSQSVVDYARKRALRIFPALIVVLLFSMFVIGPLGTNLPLAAYLRHPGTYRYLGFLLHPHLHVVDKLPGVFLNNPETGRVNGSLWTIRQEIICYAFVAFLGVLRVYRRPATLLGLIVVPYLLAVGGGSGIGNEGIHDFFDLLTYFLVGMLLYLYRERVPYSRRLLLAALVVVVVSGLFGRLPLFMPLCGGYVLFYVAFNQNLRLERFAKHGDLSYGIYLYAFPVQQLLVVYFKNALNALTLSLAALVLCGGLAALSWRFVEQPFLKLKPKTKTRDDENTFL